MLFILGIVALVSCSYKDKVIVPIIKLEPKFSSIEELIFKPNCLQCHSGAKAKMGIDLSTHAGVIKGDKSGDPIVLTGNPETSRLYKSVKMGSMPPSGPMISIEEVLAIQQWISTGAVND